jgi:nitroreductase
MSALQSTDRDAVLAPLRTRQYRAFPAEPPSAEQLDALVEVARWSGSSRNSQPWRFIVIRAEATIRRIAEAGQPQTRALASASAAIAIAMPAEEGRQVGHAFDEGRVAERLLIGASMLGIGAGISWVRTEVRPLVGELLGLPEDRFVRTLVALGRPSEAARAPKSAPGEARRARSETVFFDRWPPDQP